MKKLDKIIIVFFVVLAIALGVGMKINSNRNYNKKYAEIYVKGEFYKKVELDKKNPKEVLNIKTDLGDNVIEIENGGVRIIDADCPDKVCVKDGFKDKPGSVIVCLPHKVVIQIKGEKGENVVDEVSQWGVNRWKKLKS